jgi:hypothetical protein
MSRLPWCVVILLVTACDPNAKPTADEGLLISRERLSREYESCARTSDCADDLRCYHDICRVTTASVVGDYHAAAGALALQAGELDKAVEALAAAVNRYQSDKLDVPLDVLCGKGEALVALSSSTTERDQAEQAARTLHECLRAAPVGASVRQRALAGLAQLGAAGLDPELLARDEAMSAYLTQQPAKPATSALTVKATGDAKSRPRAYTEFLEHVKSEAVRDRLVPCWEASWKATRSKTFSVTLGFKYFFHEGYDETEDRDKMTIKSAAPAEGTPERCAYDVLGPVAEEFSKARRGAGRWDGNVTLVLE